MERPDRPTLATLNAGGENSIMYKQLEFDVPDNPGFKETTQEASFNAREVHDACKNNLDFLAATALPTIFRYFFPALYLAAWQWLLNFVHRERDFSQLALGLPRGFAKTTFVKLFLLYVILFTTRKFILVCAETTPKAANIISDVMDMLNEPNIKKIFGDWKLGAETDQSILKKFGFRGRNITMVAATVETVRGLNLKNERPDIMIFDDIQSRVCAESQTQSETLEREMIGTAMKAKSPHGCLFVFVGNMYPTKYSILRHLKHNKNWLKFIVGAITTKCESIWEELQPIAQLLKEFENDISMGKPEIFISEVLNDENAQSNNIIDLSRLPEWKVDPNDIAAGAFVIIDPSNDRANSDNVAIGYVEVHNALPHLMRYVEEKLSPLQTIHQALRYCMETGCRVVAVEGTAYQATLNFWAKHVCDQLGIIGIEFVEVYPGTLSKATRIINMMRSYAAGEIFVHPDYKAGVHLQITQYNPLKRDNVDGALDLLTYAPKVIELYGAYIQSMNIINAQDFEAIPVVEHNSPF